MLITGVVQDSEFADSSCDHLLLMALVTFLVCKPCLVIGPYPVHSWNRHPVTNPSPDQSAIALHVALELLDVVTM